MASTSPLIEMNLRWLRQALELLERLDDTQYVTSPKGFEPHRAGGHLRHVIGFYQCLIDGLPGLQIDYDARRREPALEQSRAAAAAAIRSIIRCFEESPAFRCDPRVWVRMEDAEAVGGGFMESSLARELQVLSSHTIHHFALMAFTLRMHEVEMDPEFGMAPSTLRYLEQQARPEAA